MSTSSHSTTPEDLVPEIVAPEITALSAVTLSTRDLQRSVAFYTKLGFPLVKCAPQLGFATFRAGTQYLNITTEQREAPARWWGRAIFYVNDVDAVHAQAVRAGFSPEFPPRDAAWGERYFHLLDPDGHEISFAKPL
jgi:catechol 2,3-dioxygenase-like lactoylglutathione lyase family enzyme